MNSIKKMLAFILVLIMTAQIIPGFALNVLSAEISSQVAVNSLSEENLPDQTTEGFNPLVEDVMENSAELVAASSEDFGAVLLLSGFNAFGGQELTRGNLKKNLIVNHNALSLLNIIDSGGAPRTEVTHSTGNSLVDFAKSWGSNSQLDIGVGIDVSPSLNLGPFSVSMAFLPSFKERFSLTSYSSNSHTLSGSHEIFYSTMQIKHNLGTYHITGAITALRSNNEAIWSSGL